MTPREQLAEDSGSPIDYLSIALRAYVPLAQAERPKRHRPMPTPSEWMLVFDTETTIDPSQRLRFGSFQWRRNGELERSGLLFDPRALSTHDQRVIRDYAQAHRLELMSAEAFVEELIFKLAYELRATIVGFNLPFDISRLAIGHSSARRRPMRGGFSFQLSPNRWRPRIQVKHLSRRASIIRFTAPPRQRTPSGMRKHSRVPVRRGFFVDVKTIAAALTSRSHTLASLAEFLNVPSRKMVAEEHGGPLTADYIAYAVNDTQVTWECFAELSRRYEQHRLVKTPIHRIYSEAGVGKAYLKEMNIEPWGLVQPDFPPELTNLIVQTYYGGRSEVRLRRVVSQVLYCDFLSMYPTVCTLMGLWRWVIAEGIDYREATDEAREFLDRVNLADLRRAESWRNFATMVQVAPADDILPVRAQYGGEPQYTIGLNRLTSNEPLWYTFADCVVSKLRTGKAPRILKALSFMPRDMQKGLAPVDIAGNPAFRVDPRNGDFFKRVIELRASIKGAMKRGPRSEWDALDSQQLALKILANATSYGIFMEMNVEEFAEPVTALRYAEDGRSFAISIEKAELPGRYFHPLLATLITGAARLMLGIAERLAIDAGLDWAFCDTDSMAFAKSIGMTDVEFIRRVEGIRKWFNGLNPYDGAGDLLKLEDANFALKDGKITGELEPLYAFAISAKRYALFNIDAGGKPKIRKASAHGLGHLLAPYTAKDAPATIPATAVPLKEIGVERWQHDFWYRIVEAALAGNPDQPKFSDLPGFDKPAASRYGATTPHLLCWFDRHNEGRDYVHQVRPFNFLTAFQPRRGFALGFETIDAANAPNKRARKRLDLPRPIADGSALQRPEK